QRADAGGALRAPQSGRDRSLRLGQLLRVRLRVRAAGGADRLLLRHGRQPGQFAGLALLGLREARQDQGEGISHLLVVGQRPAPSALVAARELHPLGPRRGEWGAWGPATTRFSA